MGATHSSVESHGMSGWFHWIQASWLPSGETRGLATKSGPLTRTAGSPLPSAGTATISLTASPPVSCRSRTPTRNDPTRRRSAKRNAAGDGGSGVIGSGSRAAVDRHPVQALIGPVGEVEPAAVDQPRAPAVLVDPGPGVEPLGQEVDVGAVRRATHDLGPPTLGRPQLAPVDVGAVEQHLAQRHRRGDDQLRRDG